VVRFNEIELENIPLERVRVAATLEK